MAPNQVLEMRGLEIRWKQSLEERRLAELEALQLLNEDGQALHEV